MKIKIGKKRFEIKPMSPLDFLEGDAVPIILFSTTLAAVKTMYEQVVGERKTADDLKKEGETQVKTLRAALKSGVISVNGKPFDADIYLKTETDLGEALELFKAVMATTFKKFARVYDMEPNRVGLYDRLAARYGKTPIEILFPAGGYSEMDAFTFNLFIGTHGINQEAKASKSLAEQLRAGR